MAELTITASKGKTRPTLLYTSMIGIVVLAFLAIRSLGEKLSAPPAAVHFGNAVAQAHVADLLHVLLALVVVIATARLLGTLFRLVHQPPVIGEIIAGILLGPSLLGYVAPAFSAQLFPAAVSPYLNILSQVGVILYMFLVGLELDPALLRKRGHATVAISHASIITPFLMGALLALVLYPRLSSRDVPFTNFALFLGVSMSVTAFPVLARILTDRRIHKSRMGAIAITCAAVDDITAWCLLAFVVSIARAESSGGVKTLGLALGYIVLMIFVVRPAMTRLALLYGNRGRLTQGVMTVIFVALLLSACATELIGIHAIFGAFALGAVIPHDSGMASDLTDRLEDLVVVLLLPAFFAFTGLRTQIGLVSGAEQWLLCLAIIGVASVGKFGGSLIAARITGLGWRDGSALGVLMNTRGLMELIVLNIGLEMGVISPTLFAMLVLMALVTTFATTPILHLIMAPEALRGAPAPTAPALREAERSAILVPVANPQGVAPLVELALAATPPDAPPPRVLALVRPPLGGVRTGLREADRLVAPRSPALAAALDFAWARSAVITPQAVWSDNPAEEILRTATEPQIGWILLGSHRAVFGRDFRGGVVRAILDRARDLPLNVGIVIQGSAAISDRLFAVVDPGDHGRAALELAARIAQRTERTLHARVLLGRVDEDATQLPLAQMLADTAKLAGQRLHTEVMGALDPARVSEHGAGLVIAASNLADQLEVGRSARGEAGAIVLVHGAKMQRLAAPALEARRSANS